MEGERLVKTMELKVMKQIGNTMHVPLCSKAVAYKEACNLFFSAPRRNIMSCMRHPDIRPFNWLQLASLKAFIITKVFTK